MKCRRCDKEWTPEMAPGSPDRPISGFHFRFIGKGARVLAFDATGAPIHPFARTDIEIAVCPTCMNRLPGKEAAIKLAQENFGARTLFGTDGSVRVLD